MKLLNYILNKFKQWFAKPKEVEPDLSILTEDQLKEYMDLDREITLSQFRIKSKLDKIPPPPTKPTIKPIPTATHRIKHLTRGLRMNKRGGIYLNVRGLSQAKKFTKLIRI